MSLAHARLALLALACTLSLACDPAAMAPLDDAAAGDGEVPADASIEDGGTPLDSGTPNRDSGTPPSGPRASTVLRVGFDDQHLAIGPDQRVHLTFVDGAAQRVHYAQCEQNCGDLDAWTAVQLLDNARLGVLVVGPYGLAVDRTGRVHMITSAVARAGSSAWQIAYGTCASDCLTPANWTFVDLSSLAPDHSLIGTNETLMVSPSGQVSFVTDGRFDSLRAAYFRCDSGCQNAAQWRAGLSAINGSPSHARLDSAGVTHVTFAGGRTSAGEQLLQYARCAGDCGREASWQVSMLGFLTSMPVWESSFEIDSADRLFIAFNQGVITQSAELNRRDLLASCAGSNCLALDTWTSAPMGELEEGDGGQSLVRAPGGGLAWSTVLGPRVRTRTCANNCANAAAWSEPVEIDNHDAIAATVHGDTASACPGRSESAGWWPRTPMTAVNDRGVVVVHNPHAIVKCPGDPNPDRMPPIGRVIASF